MRILIVGAGALGGLVGAHLAEAGEDVVLLEINQARVRLLSEEGLLISQEGQPERRVHLQVVSSLDGIEPVDLVFISVKSHQTENATRAALPAAKPSTLFLSMQNGIGNTETMAGIVGPERVLCGITYHSIQHVGPNRLRYRAGIKPIQIAPYDRRIRPEVEAVGEVFRRAGLETNVVPDIDHVIWQKLLHNAVVNPTSAVTGLTCREMLADEDLMAFMRALCDEIVAVMRARGVPIVDEEDPFRPVIGSLKALGKNRPSMWQDLARGQLTEIDAINGAIVKEARRLGLDAPHCWALTRFIHSRERQKILKKREMAQRVEQAAARAARPGPARPLRAGAGGGMPEGRVPLRTAPRLKEMVRAYYRDLAEADRDPKRRVACCSTLGPVEIVRAFGYVPYFPENHAALIGASRQASRYIPRALAEGFTQFVNSGMACDIGALLAGDSPLVTAYGIDGPPRPQVAVYNTADGLSLIPWFGFYGEHYGIPVLGLHPPALLGTVEPLDVDAAVQQHLRLIERLERLTGEKLDMDRLAEVTAHSARAAALWEEIIELGAHVPSPLTLFDLLVHMAPIVMMRGTPEAVEYYEILKAELEDRVAQRIEAVPGERHRLYWEGPPVWGALRVLAKLFLDHKAVVVASTFSGKFALTGMDPDNPIESLARTYTSVFTNRSDDYKADFLMTEFERFGVDAVVYHDGRTTPEYSNVRYGLGARVARRTGLPSLFLEADSHDLRLFSIDGIRRQLEDFIDGPARREGARAGRGGADA
ncbi:MAG: 2-dehydropantoate 2-reductase [Acidobacteria bacterium]|nr:MAG: 2-dehydropantoate 2-reductase [Acidobacteriota bacterium]